MRAKKKTRSSSSASFRSKPEKPLSQHPEKTPKASPKTAENLIDELEVQNEELREKQREIEEERRRYLDLYDFAPVGYFTFDQKGIIVELNLTGTQLLGLPKNRLIGMPFAVFLTRESMGVFHQHLKKAFSSNTKESCELKMSQRYREPVTHLSVESVTLNTDRGATCQSAVIDITERKLTEQELVEARQELVETNAQLRRLFARLLKTHEDERGRVAGDVHDSFASQLCVIKNQLQPLLGKGDDDRLNQVLRQLDVAIQDARRIQMDLRPSVLDDIGLFSALTMLCREFQDDHSHIHLEKQFLLEEGEAPDSIKTPIYRIAQEALKNIAAHSRADSVNISLTRKDSFIEFVIHDNGQGFNAEEVLASGVGGVYLP